MFRLGTFVWDASLGHFRLESFASELLLRVLRLLTLYVRFDCFARELQIKTFALDLSLRTLDWEFSPDPFRLGCVV